MNALKPDARTRTKEDIHIVRHLYLDLDEDGPAALARIRESKLVPANYTINTSPGRYQLVWRVEKVSPEQAEALLRVMARTFGGDPAATDSTRVLRIPGFKNRKYETEFLVRKTYRAGLSSAGLPAADRAYPERLPAASPSADTPIVGAAPAEPVRA